MSMYIYIYLYIYLYIYTYVCIFWHYRTFLCNRGPQIRCKKTPHRSVILQFSPEATVMLMRLPLGQCGFGGMCSFDFARFYVKKNVFTQKMQTRIYLSIYLSVCLSVCLSICFWLIYVSIYPCIGIYLSSHLSIYYLCVHVSVLEHW